MDDVTTPSLSGENALSSRSMRASSMLRPGDLIDDRYQIQEMVGKGGMCTVYKAQALLLNRAVAIKVLNPTFTKDEASIQRFQREATAVATLDHPNVIRAYGYGMIGELPYMAIEFLEGRSLSQAIKEDGPFQSFRFDGIIKQVLAGLKNAHANGIIHRDLKPSNIMLVGPPGSEQAKIVDFGIARILPESGKEIQKLTQTGEIFGTIAYMSPEQCTADGVDARSDIYAIGCIMYEMLTGMPAFSAGSSYALLAKQMSDYPAENPALGDYHGIIFKCLTKDPAQRPQTVAELLNCLSDPKRTTTTVVRPRKRAKNRSALVIAALGLFTAAAVGVFFAFGNTGSSASNPDPTIEKLSYTEVMDRFMHHRVSDKQDAEHCAMRAYKLAQNRPPKDVANSEAAVIMALHNSQKDSECDEFGSKCVDRIERSADQYMAQQSLTALGSARNQLGRYNEAIQVLNLALPLSKYPQDRVDTTCALSRAYLELDDHRALDVIMQLRTGEPDFKRDQTSVALEHVLKKHPEWRTDD